MEIDKQEKLTEMNREAFLLMTQLNEMDKTVSRLRNELLELDIKIEDALD